jgi:hypothetical protein
MKTTSLLSEMTKGLSLKDVESFHAEREMCYTNGVPKCS